MQIRQHTVETPYMVGPVHVYTAEHDQGLILFDAGPATDEAGIWFRQNIDLSRLSHVFITHCHVDHYGGLQFLATNSDAKIYIPYRDFLRFSQKARRSDLMSQHLRQLGFSGETFDRLFSLFRDRHDLPLLPDSCLILEQEMPSLGFDYLSCPGHSQSDTVFYTKHWAVTGDMLLDRLFQTPAFDIDLETGKRFNNYTAYCQSLVHLYSLRNRLICPAHRREVHSVKDCLIFYVNKIIRRAGQLRSYAESMSVAAILEEMFGGADMQPFHLYLKISELLFFRDFLNNPHLLQTALEQTGLFTEVASKYHKVIKNRAADDP